MVNTRKELSYIAFEYPSSTGMILAYLVGKLSEAIEGFVSPLAELAGEGIRDELGSEIWIENAIDGMVQQSITDCGLMDIARLRIIDFEVLVGAVGVGLSF